VCGIIGVVSNKESKRLAELVVSCLNRLEYRGYDSVGVAALSSANLEVRKAKGTVEEVVRKKNIKELSWLRVFRTYQMGYSWSPY